MILQSKRKKVMVIIGTRPEAIKMAPVIKALEEKKYNIETVVVSTSQHRDMLDQILGVFDITPHYDLNIMRPNQSLSQITCKALRGVEFLIGKLIPDLLLVQGDTTTTFATSLAAFYKKIPIGHVEAGLRTWDKYSPYPEEINRQLTSILSDLHFAPTLSAKANLLKEGAPEERIFVTGNTVVDALQFILPELNKIPSVELEGWDPKKDKLLVITAHRRENWAKPLEHICDAIKALIKRYPPLHVAFPVHLNPNVQRVVKNRLKNITRIHLIEPLPYTRFLKLIQDAYIILTDSGGIQEEAPSLGKPVFVLRRVTERPEAYQKGMAKIVGTDPECIVQEVSNLMDHQEIYESMKATVNPYGDGKAAQRIVDIIMRFFEKNGL